MFFILVFPTGQLEAEMGNAHPANLARTVPVSQSLPRPITVPPQFRFVPTPAGRHGQPCTAVGCNLFGDPKQAGMCWTHYQEHLASLPRATHSAPVARRQNEATVNIPYATQVRVTPTSATIYGPEAVFGAAETAASSGFFPPGQVSVPPPSIPTPESGLGQGPMSLGETYKRVAGHHTKCLNPTCSNYGNSSKGGLCNSCAQGQQFDDDLIGRMIYGEEEIG